jgi:aryl-alcohol dehydrogenase-like predicted oxidoreductase
VGVLARVPLASGLLTGKITRQSTFAPDDHRQFNRVGQMFDAGETFSGLGDHLDDAFAAVEEFKKLVPAGASLAQFALKWISMHPGVTCSIPGAKRADQVEDNIRAASLPVLTDSQMQACRAIYDRLIRPHVHHKW